MQGAEMKRAHLGDSIDFWKRGLIGYLRTAAIIERIEVVPMITDARAWTSVELEVYAAVLGVSVDSRFSHLAWTEKPREQGGIQGLAYPLLEDLRKELAAAYGVLDAAGAVALRGLFLIDPDGVVQHATINNLGVGRSVDETLRVLQAFQFVREHGEVCPADWKPGTKSMKADWEKSKEYFSAPK